MTIYKDNMEQYKEEYYSKIMPKVRKSIHELKKDPELQDFILQARKRTLKKLQKELGKVYEEAEVWRGMDMPFWLQEVALELRDYEKLKKRIRKFKAYIRFIENKNDLEKGKITEREIMNARERNILEFVNTQKGKKPIKIRCPFHDDKTPSFVIYDDGAHCFGCNWHGDVIDFIMERDGLSFIETIKFLN